MVDCTSGGLASKLNYADIDQVSMASEIQQRAAVPTATVGGIVNPQWAEPILQNNKASLIVLGRAVLNNPHWPLHAADALGVKQFKLPNPYQWAIGPGGPWREKSLPDQNQKQLSKE